LFPSEVTMMGDAPCISLCKITSRDKLLMFLLSNLTNVSGKSRTLSVYRMGDGMKTNQRIN